MYMCRYVKVTAIPLLPVAQFTYCLANRLLGLCVRDSLPSLLALPEIFMQHPHTDRHSARVAGAELDSEEERVKKRETTSLALFSGS